MRKIDSSFIFGCLGILKNYIEKLNQETPPNTVVLPFGYRPSFAQYNRPVFSGEIVQDRRSGHFHKKSPGNKSPRTTQFRKVAKNPQDSFLKPKQYNTEADRKKAKIERKRVYEKLNS